MSGANSLRAASVVAKKIELHAPTTAYRTSATQRVVEARVSASIAATLAANQVIDRSASVRSGRTMSKTEAPRPPAP